MSHQSDVLQAPRKLLTVIESPFAGDIEANIHYARLAVRDSLLRGEAPIASHLLYTQNGILRDEVAEERRLGIDAGHAWLLSAHQVAVYQDRGISKGMELGIARAKHMGVTVVYRSLVSSSSADL